jgi:hypothetical protein
MALQLGALRTALLDAGAKPETADRAAEEVASYENRLATIQTDIAMIKGMMALLGALQIAILVKLFVH